MGVGPVVGGPTLALLAPVEGLVGHRAGDGEVFGTCDGLELDSIGGVAWGPALP